MTDRIISLDAAIEAVMEYFPGNTINDPKYAAGKALVETLSALPAVDGWLPCRDCGGEASRSHSYGIARNGFEVECAKSMEFGLDCFSTGLCATESEARIAWNTRPTGD